MRTGFKTFQYREKGARSRGAHSCNTSVQAFIHPYLRVDFWLNPLNQFWESAKYSEESKEYYRKQLQTL